MTLQTGQLQAAVTRQLAVTTAEMDFAVAFSDAVAEVTESTSFSTATPWHAEYTAVTVAEATLKSGLAQASETWATAALAAHQAYGQALTTAKVAVRAQQLADVAEKLVEDAQNPNPSGTGGSGYPGTPPEEDVIVPPTRETADPTGWGAPSAPNVDRYTDAQGSGMTASFDIGANPIATSGGMPGSTTSFFNTTAQSNLEHHTRGESYSFLDPFGPLFRTVDQATFGGDGSAPNGWLLPSGGSMQYYAYLEGESLLPLDVDDGAEQRQQLNTEGSVGGGSGGGGGGEESVSGSRKRINHLQVDQGLKLFGIVDRMDDEARQWGGVGLSFFYPPASSLLLSPKEKSDFGYGFVTGFFYDGLGGSLHDLWGHVQWATGWAWWLHRVQSGQLQAEYMARYVVGDNFSKERAQVMGAVIGTGIQAAEIKAMLDQISAAGSQFIEDVASGDPARLQKYSDKLQLVGTLVQSAIIDLADGATGMSMQEKGRLAGYLVYQAVETVAGEIAGGMVVDGANKLRLGCKLYSQLRKLPFVAGNKAFLKALDRAMEVMHTLMKLDICFVAGTLVHTSEGLKPIEQIREGDYVLAWNDGAVDPESFENAQTPVGATHAPPSEPQFRRVLQTITTRPRTFHHLTFRVADGREETITCTATHPFHVTGRGFLAADAMSIGDRVTLISRATAVLVRRDVERSADEPFTTYNLSVEGDHTYFVGEAGYWVHNSGDVCESLKDIYRAVRAAGGNDDVARTHIAGHIRYALQKGGRNTANALLEEIEKVDNLELRRLFRDAIDDVPEFLDNFSFKRHLEGLIGPWPKGMYDPHAHHILFKRGLRGDQKALVKEGQAILRKVGIDPIFGREVLVWAPMRVVDQHGIVSLTKVVEILRQLDRAGADRDDFVRALRQLGREAALRR